MSTYAIKATFYINDADSEADAEFRFDNALTPELACNYEVADTWKVSE